MRLPRLLVLLSSFVCLSAFAQTPPESQKILDTLSSLTSLQSPAWRYHTGNLPHGESPTLDDSSWPTTTAPSTLPNEALWMRATLEVPKDLHGYDLSGTQISFRLRVEANGPITQIVYFNGRRVAMGTDLEPITLFSDARPGEKVLVAVKLLHSEDQKGFHACEENIQFAASRPNPEDVHDEAASAAILLPALGDNSEQKLNAAIQSISLSALSSGNQAAFDESLRQAHTGMMALRPILQ